MSMPGCGLDGANVAVVGVDGWGWLSFRLLDVASGCRCTVEGVQNMLAGSARTSTGFFSSPSARCGWMGMSFVLGAFGAVWMNGDGGFSKCCGCWGNAKKTIVLEGNLSGLEWEGTGNRCENESRIEQLSGFERSV